MLPFDADRTARLGLSAARLRFDKAWWLQNVKSKNVVAPRGENTERERDRADRADHEECPTQRPSLAARQKARRQQSGAKAQHPARRRNRGELGDREFH